MDRNLDPILHIGAPKCGSSSLQRALSLRPTFTSRAGVTYRYIVLRREQILGGLAIKLIMKTTRRAYLQSARFDEIILTQNQDGSWHPNARSIARIRKLFAQMRARNEVPIISNEGNFSLLSRHLGPEIFQHLGLKCQVFVYVRPQVEWINSAWWQWGLWEEFPYQKDFSAWFPAAREGCNWLKRLKNLREIDQISNLNVALANGNVVAQFFEAIGCDAPADAAEIENRSLDISAIKFLLNNRGLRKDIHDSKAALILAKLKVENSEKPWCLSANQVQSIIRHHLQHNKALLEFLAKDQAERMRADPHWWQADSYNTARVHKVGAPDFLHEDDAQSAFYRAELRKRGFKMRASA
ncbi:hypothetical protein AB9F29_09740 [Falsihalocynthiibacter sp. S25ZX9]|uniref:hypothetical protein n=1 Tax=Falsihalocynthiibacter sp. S25ZX9 TaxID=3240870 RepID=UPI003510B57C